MAQAQYGSPIEGFIDGVIEEAFDPTPDPNPNPFPTATQILAIKIFHKFVHLGYVFAMQAVSGPATVNDLVFTDVDGNVLGTISGLSISLDTFEAGLQLGTEHEGDSEYTYPYLASLFDGDVMAADFEIKVNLPALHAGDFLL